MSITIGYIEGRSPDYTKGLAPNESPVMRAVEHYCRVWERSGAGLSELHGDYSLGNIIFNEAGLHVTDWEHFSRSSAPWGFDALYLVLEVLWFGMQRRVSPSAGEARILSGSIKLLQQRGELEPDMRKTPVTFLKRFINEHSGLWGPQCYKFPILHFSDSQTRAIDEAMGGL
jgi:hypothetical protein